MNNSELKAALKAICEQSAIPALDCCTTNGTTSQQFSVGIGSSQGVSTTASRTIEPSRFLIASITKPIVAMAVLKLAAEGRLSLATRIPDLFRNLRNSTYRRITVRHLLTHSSGLGESVQQNLELRQAAATSADFMKAAELESLIFSPGTTCKYSSIGYMFLGSIVEQITERPLSEYLRAEIFEPLGMASTSLGTMADDPSVLPNDLPTWQHNADNWGWNSNYWKQFAAAWGGMYSTSADLIRLAKMLLNEGRTLDGSVVLPTPVVRSMMANQTASLKTATEVSGPSKNWSFGFRMQWPEHTASFCDFVSGHTVGHWGATGTLLWIDPVTGSAACVLTTVPFEKSRDAIQRISNLLACQLKPN
ncbi:MAG: serine hydrolase domain-containing protein [Fuerstiella sp.]